jgi:hypothetical protein
LTNRVTIIAPGLLEPVLYLDKIPVKELPELACLSLMLSRGQLSQTRNLSAGHYELYDCLFNLLGNHQSIENSSIASICYAADQNSHNVSASRQWILRADPCFIAPDRDQLVLAKIQNMDLSLSEATQLVTEINNFFRQYEEEKFWELQAVSAQRWYIVSQKPISLETVPPEIAFGKSLKTFLPGGQDAQHWVNLFNEFQMILHQSQVNKQRLIDKKTPVNSLWLWGSEIQKPVRADKTKSPDAFTTIYSDNIVVHGLAQLQQKTVLNIPESYQSIGQAKDESVLYVLEELSHALQNLDLFSWVGLLKRYEEDFFQPLLDDLKSGKVQNIEFISPSGKQLVITRQLLRRWWRKKHPFYSYYVL